MTWLMTWLVTLGCWIDQLINVWWSNEMSTFSFHSNFFSNNIKFNSIILYVIHITYSKLTSHNKNMFILILVIWWFYSFLRYAICRKSLQARIFCDLCGAFDQHPTLECPSKLSSRLSSQTKSSYLPKSSSLCSKDHSRCAICQCK